MNKPSKLVSCQDQILAGNQCLLNHYATMNALELFGQH